MSDSIYIIQSISKRENTYIQNTTFIGHLSRLPPCFRTLTLYVLHTRVLFQAAFKFQRKYDIFIQ